MDRRCLEAFPITEYGLEQTLLEKWPCLEIDQSQDAGSANRGFDHPVHVIADNPGLERDISQFLGALIFPEVKDRTPR